MNQYLILEVELWQFLQQLKALFKGNEQLIKLYAHKMMPALTENEWDHLSQLFEYWKPTSAVLIAYYNTKHTPITDIAEKFNVSRPTVYKLLQEAERVKPNYKLENEELLIQWLEFKQKWSF